MTYLLTIWLLVAGQAVGVELQAPPTIDCEATAYATAVENDARLLEFSCVLEVDA